MFLADTLALSRKHPDLLESDLVTRCRGELYISEDEWAEHQGGIEDIEREVQQVWDLLK